MSTCPLSAQIKEWRPLTRALVWRCIRRSAGNVSIDDLQQAADIGIWLAIKRHDGVRELKPYAAKMAYCCILNEIRNADYLNQDMRDAIRRGDIAKMTHVEYDEDLDIRSDDETPCDLAERAEGLDMLAQYLPLLPDRWQRVLAMRYDEGQTWHDIAAAFGHRRHTWAVVIANSAVMTLRKWVELGKPQPIGNTAGKSHRRKRDGIR